MDNTALRFNQTAFNLTTTGCTVAQAGSASTLADDFPWHRIRRLYRK